MRSRSEFLSVSVGLCAILFAGTALGQSVLIELQVVADGLTAPVSVTHANDGSGRLFIVDQAGTIRVVKGGVLLPVPFLDLSTKIVTQSPIFDERGLLGLAFHPNYRSNGRFFVRYSRPRAGDPGEPCNDPTGFIVGCHEEVLSEFRVLGDPATSDVADASSETILFRVDEPQFNHDSGTVAFGPDGLLYFTLGDGGGANDGLADMPPSHGPIGNGQNVDTALGSVLRLDVDGPPTPGLSYAIPPGNPFAGGGGRPEIYAYGFRNPFKFAFDDGPGGDGSLYVADVGQNLFEEIDILPVAAAGGLLNFGWAIREGFNCFDPLSPNSVPASCPATGPFGEPLLNPVTEFPHPISCASDADCAARGTTCGSDGFCAEISGIAVIGGFVYRGTDNPPLRGKYVFGDFSQGFFTPGGRLFFMDIAGPDAFQIKDLLLAPMAERLGKFVKGFGEDERGEIYVCASDALAPSGDTGVVFRIVNAQAVGAIPTTSTWGLIVLGLVLLAGAKVAFGRPQVVR